jgi:hypothetical protein
LRQGFPYPNGEGKSVRFGKDGQFTGHDFDIAGFNVRFSVPARRRTTLPLTETQYTARREISFPAV